MSDIADAKQRRKAPSTAFKPGQSGNPKGKPRGMTSSSVKLREAISLQLPDVLDVVVNAAKGGDMQACRLLMERVLPPIRATDAPISIKSPEGAGLIQQGEAVMAAAINGEVPASQAGTLLGALANLCVLKNAEETEKRLAALEQQLNGGNDALDDDDE